MIYIKQYNSIFDSPRVEKHTATDNFWTWDPRKDEAYNKWLCSKIEVIGNPDWKDGAEKIEGVDYRLQEQFSQGTSLNSTTRIIAIPITQKTTIDHSETAPLNKDIEGLVLDAYYAGFNQAHYGHIHPEVFPPKECESAGIEYLESKKTHIQFVLKRTQKP